MAAEPPLKAFSIRKDAKQHGAGGRLVGPIDQADRVVVLEDTTTTGSAILEAVDVLNDADIEVLCVISLVDRSGGAVAHRMAAAGLPYRVIVTTDELGVL